MNRAKIPDYLTAYRMIAVVPFLLILAGMIIASEYYPELEKIVGYAISIALLALIITIELSDLLDGPLARQWKENLTNGSHLDPIADKILDLLFIPMAALGLIHWAVPVAVFYRHTIVCGLRDVVRAHNGTMPALLSGKVKMWIGCFELIILTMALPIEGSAFASWHWLKPLAWWGGWVTAVAFTYSLWAYHNEFCRRGLRLLGND